MLLTYVEYHIKGLTQMVMHNGQLADPANRYSIAMKEITKKRNKTPDDFKALEDLEWEGSLYLDDELRVVVPGTSIVGAMCLAGKKSRDGERVRSAVISPGNWPLIYPGPKVLDKLKADPNYRMRSSVVVPATGNRVMRCRPVFREWSLKFRIGFRADLLSPKEIHDIIRTLGTDVGLSDDRKLMGGRFEIVAPKLADRDTEAA